MGKILDYVINSTAQYMEHIPKKQRKSYGRVYLMCLLIRLKLQFLIQVLALGFSPLR